MAGRERGREGPREGGRQSKTPPRPRSPSHVPHPRSLPVPPTAAGRTQYRRIVSGDRVDKSFLRQYPKLCVMDVCSPRIKGEEVSPRRCRRGGRGYLILVCNFMNVLIPSFSIHSVTCYSEFSPPSIVHMCCFNVACVYRLEDLDSPGCTSLCA